MLKNVVIFDYYAIIKLYILKLLLNVIEFIILFFKSEHTILLNLSKKLKIYTQTL